MHDPISQGGLRVLREQADAQTERHKRVESWRAETERLLETARAQHLLVADADPPAISSTLLATLVGHHRLAGTHPDSPTTWDRMTTTWLGLLPTIADQAWLQEWSAPTWGQRPAPTRNQFENARRPDATPRGDAHRNER
jgi:hypothetical protein